MTATRGDRPAVQDYEFMRSTVVFLLLTLVMLGLCAVIGVVRLLADRPTPESLDARLAASGDHPCYVDPHGQTNITRIPGGPGTGATCEASNGWDTEIWTGRGATCPPGYYYAATGGRGWLGTDWLVVALAPDAAAEREQAQRVATALDGTVVACAQP